MSGELTAKDMAKQLGVSATRVQQLWTSGKSRTCVQSAKFFRVLRIEQSIANHANSVDFAGCHDSRAKSAATHEDEYSSSSDSSFTDCFDGAVDADGGRGSASNSDSESTDVDAGADVVNPMELRKRSRNLSGKHYIRPQLMDLCMEGIACWGHFYESLRPFDQRILIFRPADGEEPQLTHDDYMHLVLSVYKRYHKGDHPPGTANSRMLECLRQVVQHEQRSRDKLDAPIEGVCHSAVDTTDPQYLETLRQCISG